MLGITAETGGEGKMDGGPSREGSWTQLHNSGVAVISCSGKAVSPA